MNSRERVLTAMAHREPDRVPRYLFYTPEVFKEISRILGLDTGSDQYIFDIEMGLCSLIKNSHLLKIIIH